MQTSRLTVAAVFVIGVVTGLVIERLGEAEIPAIAHEGHPEHTDPKLDAGLAKVLTVEHGDEFTVLWRPPVPVRFNVRLNRVDTPFKDKPGGEEATEELADRVYGKYVRLEFESNDKPFQDRSQRLIAYVFDDDEHVNVDMVRRGVAPFFTRYGEGRFGDDFKAAESEARQAKRGVWADEE